MPIPCALRLAAVLPLSATFVDDPAPSVRTPKVLLIGIDGCRTDALMAARTPNLHALMNDGCWTDRSHTGPYTCSGPGWSSVLCGVWMARHGVKDNTFRGAAFDRWPHFFTRLKEARPDVEVGSFVSWVPIDRYLTPSRTDVRFAHDCRDGGDALVTDRAVRALSGGSMDASFVCLGDVDETGHRVGFDPGRPEYLAAVEAADAAVGRLLHAVRARPSYAAEDWLVLVTPDHGGTPDGAHGRDIPAHRQIFYIASGSAAGRGRIVDTVNQVDVVVTALAHLGVDVSLRWGLEGRVRGLKRGPRALGENLVDNGDAEAVEPGEFRTTDLGIPGWEDLGGVTTVAYGGVEGVPTHDRSGRHGRGLFIAGERDATMRQTIDLSAFVSAIDDGSLAFEFSAWMGGGSVRRDMARADVEFVDESGTVLRSAGVRPSGADGAPRRKRPGAPALAREACDGPIPRGARVAVVTLNLMTGAGEDDGFADDIALALRPVAALAGAAVPLTRSP